MKKIMVIDDDPSLLALARAFLLPEHEVFIFSSAASALEAAPEIKPDLIIVDVLMATMTGYEFLVSLKKDDSLLKNVPVMIMSTREHLKNVFEGEEAAFFLQKPFSREQLMEAVSRCFV